MPLSSCHGPTEPLHPRLRPGPLRVLHSRSEAFSWELAENWGLLAVEILDTLGKTKLLAG